MNKDYCIQGTKIVMRRIFKAELDDVIGCYADYEKLYHNLVNRRFIESCLVYGEIWGAFWNESLIAACYYFPLDSSFYTLTPSYGAICDFIEKSDEYFYIGYIGIKHDKIKEISREKNCAQPSFGGLYTVFLNIGHTQGFRRGFKKLIHTLPVKLHFDIEPMFCNGYRMSKMRGLDKLVVHYIFEKDVLSCESICTRTETVNADIKDTKKISALLESGYSGIDIDKTAGSLLLCPLVSDN